VSVLGLHTMLARWREPEEAHGDVALGAALVLVLGVGARRSRSWNWEGGGCGARIGDMGRGAVKKREIGGCRRQPGGREEERKRGD
jgi:hypothetical protein